MAHQNDGATGEFALIVRDPFGQSHGLTRLPRCATEMIQRIEQSPRGPVVQFDGAGYAAVNESPCDIQIQCAASFDTGQYDDESCCSPIVARQMVD